MSEPLIAPRFLFRFAIPCRQCKTLWTAKGTSLGEGYRLPDFSELERPRTGPDVRVGWNRDGLAFRFEIHGKCQEPWCRDKTPEDSDGVQIWLDTRDVKTVHRAGRFCHRLFFLPMGAGRGHAEPVAGVMPIHRARAPHGPIDASQLKVLSERLSDGYVLHAMIAADALTGFDPAEHPRLGFTWAVTDRELGEQTLGIGSPSPYQQDPSLWSTLELIGPKS